MVECLPLQHGIALLRDLNSGVFDAAMLGHVAYFVAMAAIGLVVDRPQAGTLLTYIAGSGPLFARALIALWSPLTLSRSRLISLGSV